MRVASNTVYQNARPYGTTQKYLDLMTRLTDNSPGEGRHATARGVVPVLYMCSVAYTANSPGIRSCCPGCLVLVNVMAEEYGRVYTNNRMYKTLPLNSAVQLWR